MLKNNQIQDIFIKQLYWDEDLKSYKDNLFAKLYLKYLDISYNPIKIKFDFGKKK